MNISDITIKAEDVQAAVTANPAVDWALKEQALLRKVNELDANQCDDKCACKDKEDVDEIGLTKNKMGE